MVNDSQFLAGRIADVQTAGAARIDIAFDIDLHTVGDTGLIAVDGEQYLGTLFGQSAVRLDLEGPDVAPSRVVHVQYAFVGGEHQPVGYYEVVYQ